MNIPWIECGRAADPEKLAGPNFADYGWQAMFACQVGIREHQDWARLKWGFNVAALFEEFLARQRLFLESQYSIRNDMRLESPERQTLAFRFVQRPADGLSANVLGKVFARTEAEAAASATAFARGIDATLPYDYSLSAARTRQEFLHISGQDILEEARGAAGLAQIRRAEIPAVPDKRSPVLQGLWHTAPRAHEPIWRSLASSPIPLVMNVLLRSTILYEREQALLLKSARQVSELDEGLVNTKTLTAIQAWSARCTERRLMPWKKFFYLQVHLASSGDLDDNLCRIIGTSLTLPADQDSLPGYQVIVPPPEEEPVWRRHLASLSLVPAVSRLAVPRLADLADLEEVFAVMRLPYSPPDAGFPNVRFASPGTAQLDQEE